MTDREIFKRYGYDPDDPARGKEVPLRLINRMGDAPLVEPEKLERQFRPRSEWGTLSATELNTLKLVAKGLTNAEIAQEMGVGRETVKTRLKMIYRVLRVRSRAQAVAEALAQGLIEL